jgi:hypothetical protein
MTMSILTRGACLSLGALLLFAMPAFADDVECHASKDFHVAAKAYEEDTGVQLAVKALKPGEIVEDCRFDAASADRIIGEPGDPLWFGELHGNVLVLTRSTGPLGDVVVHDLAKATTLLDAPVDDYEVSNGTLVFWERVAEATAENCPDLAENEANGMGSVIAEEKTLVFADGTVKSSGNSRCDATQ